MPQNATSKYCLTDYGSNEKIFHMIFPLTAQEIKSEYKSYKKAFDTKDASSSLGQRIGKLVSKGASAIYHEILREINGYELGKPIKGKKSIRLPNTLGKKKEIDDVIVTSDSKRPVVLCESKWLKDQRHLNDKGAWVTLMREVQLANSTVRGLIAILAGPWASELPAISQRVKVIAIHTNEVYERLQDDGIHIRIDTERNIYDNPMEALEGILSRVHAELKNGNDYLKSVGYDLLSNRKNAIHEAILNFLDTSQKLEIDEVELILRTTHGNLIWRAPTDPKVARDFLGQCVNLSESGIEILLTADLKSES